MPTYAEVETPFDLMIVRTDDDGSQTWIPKDEGNADYQQYLADEQAAS